MNILLIFGKLFRQKKHLPKQVLFIGGPDRIRTDDPYNANVMRSQLRYRPIVELFGVRMRLYL